MSKFQMLRLLVALPKVSRLPACQFCASNHMETNVRCQSVFERYVEFQIKNKLPLNYGRVIEEGEEDNNKLELDRAPTTVKSKVDLNSVSNQKISGTVVDRATKTEKSYAIPSKRKYINKDQRQLNKIHIPDPNSPLRYILNCELMPDVKSAMNSEDYLLFHEHLEKFQMYKLPSVSEIIWQMTPKKEPTTWNKRPKENKRIYNQDNSVYPKPWFKNVQMGVYKYDFKPINTVMNDPVQRKLVGSFQKTICIYLNGEKNIEISPDLQGHWNSIKHVLDSFEKDDIKVIDVIVYHPLLHYRGVIAFIAVYRNTLCVIDLKTSYVQRPYISSTDNYPLVVAANLGAVFSSYNPALRKICPSKNGCVKRNLYLLCLSGTLIESIRTEVYSPCNSTKTRTFYDVNCGELLEASIDIYAIPLS